MSSWSPDEAWLDQIFETEVLPDVFASSSAQAPPVVVLLGAQPGAGKTRAGQFAQELHGGGLTAIVGDDFRALHPDFKRLQRDDPEAMPQVTQAVSGPLVKRCLEYARAHRISVLVEGTFRDPDMVLATTRSFREAGFDVHVVALAVPPEVSRASTLGRFYETLGTDQNRWTPPAAHEAAVAAMPRTVAHLARATQVGRFTILDRDGVMLEDSADPGPQREEQMRSRIEIVYRRPLTTAERELVSRTHAQAQQSGPPLEAVQASRATPGQPRAGARKGRPQTPRVSRRASPGSSRNRDRGVGR